MASEHDEKVKGQFQIIQIMLRLLILLVKATVHSQVNY